jgi:RNA polymerase sigma-70 factor (ECF subfamily)
MPSAADADSALPSRLRDGDEEAFNVLVERYHRDMLRLALSFVSSRAVAEVVQDTWLAMLRGLSQFEGRPSLRTWLFTILVNQARTAGRPRGTHHTGRRRRARCGRFSLRPVGWMGDAARVLG